MEFNNIAFAGIEAVLQICLGMKKMTFTFVVSLIPLMLLGQDALLVNAGRDTNFCGSSEFQNEFAPFTLSASVTGGVPPYSIVWTMVNPVFFDNQTWGESYFLDSTTNLHPLVKTNGVVTGNGSIGVDVMTFAISVNDSIDGFATDTVVVSSSYFSWSLVQLFVYTNEGDSVRLFKPNFSGGIPPLKYEWEPSTFMSLSHTESPVVSPKETTNYNVTVTDAKGCQEKELGSHNTVYVIPLGITDDVQTEKMSECIDIFDHKISIKAFCAGSNEPFMLNIYDLNGRLVHQCIFKVVAQIPSLQSGQYIIHIANSQGNYITKTVII